MTATEAHNIREARVSDHVRAVLTPDLLGAGYTGQQHCYAASEALYHLLGGKAAGLKPETVRHEGGPHWHLRDTITGLVLDPTFDQFDTPPPYDQGVGRGFLTKQPSKRAAEIIRRVRERRGY